MDLGSAFSDFRVIEWVELIGREDIIYIVLVQGVWVGVMRGHWRER